MKQKEFREMCIRLGLATDELKIDYTAVATKMALGLWYMIEQYPRLKDTYMQDLEIVHEYLGYNK